VTSRADDFDVRHEDAGSGRHRAPGVNKAAGSGIDYDLGYGEPGWDTQGFRRPEDGYAPVSFGDPDYSDAGDATQVHSAYASRPNAGYPETTFDRDMPGEAAYGEDTRYEDAGYGTITTYAPAEPVTPVPSRRGPGGPGRRGGGGGRGGRGGRPRDRVKIKGSWWRHWTWRKALGVFLGMVGGLICLMAAAVAYVYSKTPVPSEALAAVYSSQTMVYADDGHTIIGRLGTTDRQPLNYSQIPDTVIYSVLAAEDRNFFNEGGISPTGIIRAAISDLTSGGNSLQGGSTITQEFVRQYYTGIGTQQTASRKLKEIFVAMKIARSESKQWILENYLNTIYFGQGANGIGAASQIYFGIPVSKLTWAQAAVLAAVIQQPTNFPLKQYHADLVNRWNYVLSGLVKMGKLSQAQVNGMQFPAFGDHVPQEYGKDVWDPYVLNVVKNELEGVYHLSESQIFNGGYKIVTTVDPAKMKALYSAINLNETQINSTAFPMRAYMHAGAVVEDPATGAIQAWYGGPGYTGARYNGVGKVISAKTCVVIKCNYDSAIYDIEQVGSSFKPYILSAAVANGMNVQTSWLDGQDHVCIPPDSSPSAFPASPTGPTGKTCQNSWFLMDNDSTAENGAFRPLDAMTQSVNTAYADLWHYVGGKTVAHMAANFGMDLVESGIEGSNPMVDEAGVALGQASVSVLQQASMVATIDDNGVFHTPHVIKQLMQGGVSYPLKVTTRPVFSGVPSVNAQMDSQVQYAMEQVVTAGTATNANMNDGRPIIGKTGTTDFAQSAFFTGAIPQQALAVALFTDHQGLKNDYQTLNNLGGQGQGFGGTWPALMWHTYAESEFAQLPPAQFQQPTFTGAAWNLAPQNLIDKKTHPKKKQQKNGNQFPTPTQTCPPGQITVACTVVPTTGTQASPTPMPSGPFVTPSFGPGAQTGGAATGGAATPTGAAAVGGGILGATPLTLLWVRRRERKRARPRSGRGQG
jgi:membrane peptidoglycan carboxypeptidase